MVGCAPRERTVRPMSGRDEEQSLVLPTPQTVHMSETVSTGQQESADVGGVSPLSRARRLPGRRWIVAVLVVLVALGLTLAYSLWWTKPTTFGVSGNEFGSNVFGFRQTTETMHPVTVDMVQRSVYDDAETITVHDVSPRVVANTADALITFAVCRRSEDFPFASADGPGERSCETVSGVEGQQMHLTGDAITTITMTVAPRRHGRVVIRGMEVDYSRGSDHLWQRGSQATGPVVKVQVRK